MPFGWSDETFRYADLRVRFWALKILLDLGLPWSELEDIRSDLWVHLLSQIGKYDPNRASLHTFISTVVKNRGIDIIRSWRVGKNRRRWQAISLNEPIVDDNGDEVERQDFLSADDYRKAWTGSSFSSEIRLIEVAELLARRSKEDRRLCLELISKCLFEIDRSGRLSTRKLAKSIREIQRILGLIE